MSFKKMFVISKKEWSIFSIASFFLIVVSNFFVVFAFLKTPDGFVYNGVLPQSPSDIFVYYSYINQAKDGNIFFYNYFTPEHEEIGMINIAWGLVGFLSKIFHISEIFAFHATKIIFAPFMLISIFLFICYFFKKPYERFICFFLALSSGVGGWVSFFLKPSSYSLHGYGYNWPIDLWTITHAYVITTLSQSPHFILSWFLEVLIFLFGFISFYKNSYAYSIIAGVMACILFNFHPYHAPVLFLSFAIYGFFLFFISSKKFAVILKHSIIILIISLPSILYHRWALQESDVLLLRASQNITLLPPLFYVFLGYGALLILVLISLIKMIEKKQFDVFRLFAISWFFAILLLIIIPIPFQSKFLQTWVIPMSLIATYFVAPILEKLNMAVKKNFFIIVVPIVSCYIIFFFFSNIINVVRPFFILKQNPNMFYVSQNFYDSILWIKDNIEQESIILSSIDTGHFIAGMATKKVYLGHGHETLYKNERMNEVKSFFGTEDESFRAQFLEDKKVQYIFLGPYEKSMTRKNFDNPSLFDLEYENNEVLIYRYITL